MHDATLAEIAEALGHKTLAMVKRVSGTDASVLLRGESGIAVFDI